MMKYFMYKCRYIISPGLRTKFVWRKIYMPCAIFK